MKLRQVGNATLYHGDSREVLKSLPPASVDACITDPPYNLTSIRKRFGKPGSAECQYGKDGAFRRAARGFMGKLWDTGEVTEDPAFWALVLEVVKPGAFLLAFGGTRSHHRMMCAIEDAGFEIRESIAWLFGSGLPKSHNLGDGRGTALKPAFEVVVCARKPLIGTVRENVERFGTGAINIDACRIQASGESLNGGRSTGAIRARIEGWNRPYMDDAEHVAELADASKERVAKAEQLGRWPANVILSESAAAELDRQSGVLTSGDWQGETPTRSEGTAWKENSGLKDRPIYWKGDSGGASRFFYVAKADRREREQGCEELPPTMAMRYGEKAQGPLPQQTPSKPTAQANHHPTVKPVSLMSYLIRLITPPCGVVLDPFMGSGTTGVSCLRETYRFIGIEKEDDYYAISCAKCTDAANLVGLFSEADA